MQNSYTYKEFFCYKYGLEIHRGLPYKIVPKYRLVTDVFYKPLPSKIGANPLLYKTYNWIYFYTDYSVTVYI